MTSPKLSRNENGSQICDLRPARMRFAHRWQAAGVPRAAASWLLIDRQLDHPLMQAAPCGHGLLPGLKFRPLQPSPYGALLERLDRVFS